MKLVLRVEEPIKDYLYNLAGSSKWSISQLVEKIAWVGLEVLKEGGITIEGFFGINRPFAFADFGSRSEYLTIWVNNELNDRLQTEFSSNVSDGLREALKSGVLVIDASNVEIRNRTLNIRLPLASIGNIQLTDPNAIIAMKEIKEIIENQRAR